MMKRSKVRARKTVVVAGALNAMWVLAGKSSDQSAARLGSFGVVKSGKQKVRV